MRQSRGEAKKASQEAEMEIKRIHNTLKALQNSQHGFSLDLNKINYITVVHERLTNLLSNSYDLKFKVKKD